MTRFQIPCLRGRVQVGVLQREPRKAHVQKAREHGLDVIVDGQLERFQLESAELVAHLAHCEPW